MPKRYVLKLTSSEYDLLKHVFDWHSQQHPLFATGRSTGGNLYRKILAVRVQEQG